jgi:probable F420-dependent oxidoreductase
MEVELSDTELQYGILLPHFGRYATSERIRAAGPMVEGFGFDSAWVRDHVIQQPHGHEDPDLTYLDAFVTLSTVAATTERLKLASAVIIPHRHPILAAMMFASLDFVSGGGRIIAGCGIGNWDKEFEAIGIGQWDRRELLEEYVGIMKQLWAGGPLSHESEHYRFEDVEISPVPAVDAPIPVWYGGNSAAAVRRAVEYCEGWVASRIPLSSFTQRIKRLRRLSSEAGKRTPDVGVIPYIIPARTVEAGLRRLNAEALLADLQRHEPPPPSGAFSSVEDIGGAAIVGPAEVIVERVRQFQQEGTQHFVFDLRPCLEDWEDRLAYLGEEVLPLLRAGDQQAPASQVAHAERR